MSSCGLSIETVMPPETSWRDGTQWNFLMLLCGWGKRKPEHHCRNMQRAATKKRGLGYSLMPQEGLKRWERLVGGRF